MYLTELLESVETLSVFEKFAQIFWGDVFTWKDLFEFIGAVSGVAVIVFGPIRWIKNNILKISAPYKAYKEDIDAVLGEETRKRSEKYYIPTRGQDVDPCNEEEIRENNGKYNTEEMIPFLCKKAFLKDSFGKHYIILADAGMGKTTFLVNLYRYYVLKKRFWPKDRKNMRYIPLSSENCMEKIQEIENPGKTILLLDALDESRAAMEDCDAFMENLLKETEGFYKIVITCRTHFFANEKKEPENTGLVRPGTGNKNLKFTKKYITPFSDDEVNAYLKKRFRFRIKTQKKAKEIVKKVPSIMARPLILDWIDYLVETNEKLEYTYEIYKIIIAKWIEREPEMLTKGKLLDLSKRIAEWMMDHTTTYIPGDVVEGMASEEGIDLLPIVAKSRSLLNRNSNGEYKFSHRSFLEYFLSEQVYNVGIPFDKAAYLCKMSAFGRFLVEKLCYNAYSINRSIIKPTRCYYTFLLPRDNLEGDKCDVKVLFIERRQLNMIKVKVELMCEIHAQTGRTAWLVKSDYRKVYYVTRDINLMGINFANLEYEYVTPMFLEEMFDKTEIL